MQRVAWHCERRRYELRYPKISSTERRLSDLNMIQSDDICMACLGFFCFGVVIFHLHFFLLGRSRCTWILIFLAAKKGRHQHGVSWICPFLIHVSFLTLWHACIIVVLQVVQLAFWFLVSSISFFLSSSCTLWSGYHGVD